MARLFRPLICALTVLCTALPAQAYNPFEDVPADHWAYDALEFLSERSVVEGYPDGVFQGERLLTRYEFAIAVARLMDSAESSCAFTGDLQLIAEIARQEFSAELALIDLPLAKLEQDLPDLELEILNIEIEASRQSDRIEALEAKFADL